VAAPVIRMLRPSKPAITHPPRPLRNARIPATRRCCYRFAFFLASRRKILPSVTLSRANQDRLLKVKGNGAITEASYRKAFGLIPDPDRHGKRVWLKSKVLRKFVFEPSAVSSAMTQLGKSAVIVSSNQGLMAQQQRVPRLKIKDYFYVLDEQKLRALRSDKDRR